MPRASMVSGDASGRRAASSFCIAHNCHSHVLFCNWEKMKIVALGSLPGRRRILPRLLLQSSQRLCKGHTQFF